MSRMTLLGAGGPLSGVVSTLALALYFNESTITSAGAPSVDTPSSAAITYSNTDTDAIRRQYDADGVLQYGPHNSLAASDLTDGVYTADGVTVAASGTDPDGNTAYLIEEIDTDVGNKWIFDNNFFVGNQEFEITVRIKEEAASGRNAYLRMGGNVVTVDPSDGTEVSTSGSAEFVSSTLLGDGWYEVTVKASSWNDVYFGLSDSGTSANYTGDTTPGVYYAAASVGRYPRNQSFVTAQSFDGARLTHQPVTNHLSYPEQFDTSPWATLRASVSSGQSDPLGGTNAFKLIEDGTASNTHRISVLNVGPGDKTTISIYAKADERSAFSLNPATTSGTGVLFNLAGQSTHFVGVSVDDAQIIAVDGAADWYRCTVTFDTANDDFYLQLADSVDTDIATSTTYNGDGSSGLIIFGAQVNEGGIKPYVGATNLFTDDKDVTEGSDWNDNNTLTETGNTTTAPDGTTTADTVLAFGGGTGHGAKQALTLSPSTTYVHGMFFKEKSVSPNRGLLLYDTTGSDGTVVSFELDTETIDEANETLGSGLTIVDSGMDYYGNGWYYCWAATTTSTNTAYDVYFYVLDASLNRVYTAGGEESYVWGAMMHPGSAPLPYVGMPQTSFRRVSTADASAKSGLLVEAAATNLWTRSEDLTTAWSIAGSNSVTVTSDQSIGPDGLMSLDEVKITDTTDEAHGIHANITDVADTDYCFSVHIRADEQRYICLAFVGAANHWINATFDLYAGVETAREEGATSGTIAGVGITPLNNGLFQIWIAGQCASVSSSNAFRIQTVSGATPTYDTNGREEYVGVADDKFYAGFVQIETGTYPSSYIKTSGGTVTRSADNVSMTGTDFSDWWDDTAGTIIAEWDTPPIDDRTYIYGISDGTSGEAHNLHKINAALNGDGDYIYSRLRDGASDQALHSDNTPQNYNKRKTAYAFELNNVNLAWMGTLETNDTAATMPTVDRMHLGSKYDGSLTAKGMTIRQIEYHNTRRDDSTLATDSTISDDGL